jgi:hypothetical protein
MSDFDDWVALHTGSKIDPVLRRQMRYAFNAGRESMKADILAMLKTCLDRDPTLQKMVQQVEGME